MNIEQMQYIVEIAKTKSLIAASQNLHISQSALSQSLTNLEMELGIKIFNRSRNGTVVTSVGQDIIQKAEEALLKVQEIKDLSSEYVGMLNEKLQIASIPVSFSLLVKTVARFNQDFPMTKISITQRNSQQVIQEVSEKQVDLGIIAIKESELESIKGLTVEPFYEGKMLLAVGKSSELATRKSISPKELLAHPIILYNETHFERTLQLFEEQFGKVNTSFTSDNALAIFTALYENIAATFFYDITIHTSPSLILDEIRTLEISDFEQEPILFCWVYAKNTESSFIVMKKFLNSFMNNFKVN
ncbi:LysR family transcriptional regulator [Solibacillus sp. FSL K6-1523]|uniref:LysR family transcriptional regulator n=1 Tax=Solibacillus sp. FSL K6-1523 TaxID=2921471 RepID=UPI0030F9EBB6